MSASAQSTKETRVPSGTGSRGAGRALVAGSVVLLLLAGVLLWASRGPAVFADIVLAAVAWCF